jgi:uracil-DNA glycosylase
MGAEDYLPDKADIDRLRTAVHDCRGCDLYKDATQAVFGEGPADASVLVIGEVPGDQEDRQGHPFVGPAGKLLDKALGEAGIDRTQVYVTNAVKHFTFKRPSAASGASTRSPAGPRSSPAGRGCSPSWTTCGPTSWCSSGRPRRSPCWAPRSRSPSGVAIPDRPERAVATVHPSSVLRSADREAAYRDLVTDLRSAATVLSGVPGGRQRTR